VKKVRAVSGLLLACWACASATPQGEKVRITSDPEAVQGCKFLGNVQSNSALGTESEEITMKNKTAALGGNVLLISSFQAPTYGAGSLGVGEAYLCGDPGSGKKP
jgi:hypothetical protein